jgi:hypothetical protein
MSEDGILSVGLNLGDHIMVTVAGVGSGAPSRDDL